MVGSTAIVGADALTAHVCEAIIAAEGGATLFHAPDAALHPTLVSLAGLRRVEVDLGQRFALPRLLADVQELIHLGQAPWEPARARDAIYRVNLEHTGHLMTAAREAGVGHVTWLSTALAVGTDPGVEWNLGDVNLPWIQSMRLAHLEVLRQGTLGLPLAVALPTLMIGPGASGPLARFTVGPAPRVLPQTAVDVIDVRDVARAIAALSLRRQRGEFPLSAHHIPLKTLIAASRKAGRGAPIPPVFTETSGRLLSGLGSRIIAGRLLFWGKRWAWGDVATWPDDLPPPRSMQASLTA